MPNAQVHLMAGLLSSLALAFFFYNLFHTGLSVLISGVMIGVMASEFPDIDHPKALPRKVLRGIMPAIILFVLAYLFFAWRIWVKSALSILAFFGAAAAMLLYYEKLIPKHRGATHKLPGLLTVIVLSLPLAFAFGGFANILVVTAFAVVGFSTHVLLDHL
jgi:membrane-bound metal-dependent hydrolase YbcI (DUF457 family)